MSLTHQDVERIAKLARIKVDETEIAAISKQLNHIVDLIEQMRTVTTDGFEAIPYSQHHSLRLREDIATEPNQREAFQALAPQVSNGLFLVPKVINVLA